MKAKLLEQRVKKLRELTASIEDIWDNHGYDDEDLTVEDHLNEYDQETVDAVFDDLENMVKNYKEFRRLEER